jgi:hypothetical protein
MGYLDSILGGIGGGTNIYEGLQEGDIGQVAGGIYGSLGAYTSANVAYQHQIFQNVYQQAIEMGLGENGANQIAHNIVDNIDPNLIGAQQIGKWLPFIGAGLIAYNAIENGIHTGQQGLMTAASLSSLLGTGWYGAAAAAFYAAPNLISHWMASGPDNKHIYYYEPDLELVYADEDGNYYLYDHNAETDYWTVQNDQYAGQFTETMTSHLADVMESGKNDGVFIKYNPETNKLERANLGYLADEKHKQFKSLTYDQTKEMFEQGWTTYTYYEEEPVSYSAKSGGDEYETVEKTGYYFSPVATDEQKAAWKQYAEENDINVFNGSWSVGTDFPATDGYTCGINKKVAGFKTVGAWNEFGPDMYGVPEGAVACYNIPSLQAQIYNEAILPSGLAPETEWESITIDGTQYYTDSSGMVRGDDGKLIGYIDYDTGNVNSFQQDIRVSYSTHGGVQESQQYTIGTIDNWEEVKPLLDEGINIQLDQDNPQDSDTPEPEDLEQPQPDQQGFQGFTPIEQPEQSEQPQPDQQGFQGFTPIEQPEQPEQPQPGQPEQPQSPETETTEQPQPEQQGFQGFMPFEPMQQTGQGGFQGFTPINPSQQEENTPNSQGFIGFENPFEM